MAANNGQEEGPETALGLWVPLGLRDTEPDLEHRSWTKRSLSSREITGESVDITEYMTGFGLRKTQG